MKSFQKIESKQELRELLDKTLFKTFFHELEWQEFLEKEFKWLKFEHYLYRPVRHSLGGGGDEALLSFARFKVFGKEKLISLPFCEYGGPLPLKENFNLEEFGKKVSREFSNIKIKFHPHVLSMCEVEPHTLDMGGSTSHISTYWVEDLDRLSEQELLASFRKTLRHSIRNAEQNDIRIKKCPDISGLKQFYNLYVANLKKRKTVPYPLSVFKYLYNNPRAEILLAWHKGRIIAGSLFLHYDKFVHYFLSASSYEHRNLGASCLILWEKIKSLCGKDKIFDLGASPKGSALEIFKRGWEGKEYPILQIGIKKDQEGLRSSKLRKVWGLLPNFIVKKASPFLIRYRL